MCTIFYKNILLNILKIGLPIERHGKKKVQMDILETPKQK